MEQFAAAQPAIQAYDAAQASFKAAQAAYQQALQNTAIVNAGPAQPLLGPEQQNDQANVQYAQAALALSLNPLGPPPQPPAVQPPTLPWSPFSTRPNDTEPTIAQKWRDRLSLAMMSPEYSRHPAPWKKLLDDFYTQERQAVATAGQPGGALHPDMQSSSGGSAPQAQPKGQPAPGPIHQQLNQLHKQERAA